MRYVLAFILKAIVILAILYLILGGILNITTRNIILISIPVIVISFIADMTILSKSGNVVTAILDFIMNLAIIWIIGAYLFEEDLSAASTALVNSLFITIFEVFYHRFLRNFIFINVDDKMSKVPTRYLETELADEFDPSIDRWKKKSNKM